MKLFGLYSDFLGRDAFHYLHEAFLNVVTEETGDAAGPMILPHSHGHKDIDCRIAPLWTNAQVVTARLLPLRNFTIYTQDETEFLDRFAIVTAAMLSERFT